MSAERSGKGDDAVETSDELTALRETVRVLTERVEALQNRRVEGFAVFESMAHLEARVEERTRELERARREVERLVEARTEELQRQAAELERANATLREMDRIKTNLLQNVSHELKTPLVSIKGYTELLLDRLGKNLEPRQREFLEVIRRNADVLNGVIESLVDAGKIARGSLTFDHSRFDIVRLAREVGQEIAPLAQKYAVTFESELPPRRIELLGDRGQIRHMLVNLLTNACKFCDGRPERRVDLRLRDLGDDVLIEVADTGVGIPRERVHRIFDRFYQVDPTATRRYGGMGLGLALVREVVEGHEGTIFVESEPGEGTRFLVRLPLVTTAFGETSGPAAASDLEPADVFVIEDEPESATLYGTILEGLGWRRELFTHAGDALDRLRPGHPRLILLDLAMPGMSGMAFLEALRERLPEADWPPVIVLTARSRDETLELDLGAPVREILHAPCSMLDLGTAVQRVLGGATPDGHA